MFVSWKKIRKYSHKKSNFVLYDLGEENFEK